MEWKQLYSLSRHLQVCKEPRMFKITLAEVSPFGSFCTHVIGLNESKVEDLKAAKLQAAVLGEQSPFIPQSLERGRSFQGHLT